MSDANGVCGTVEADFPGGPDAKRRGCRCTAGCHDVAADGTPGYWINVECPMHGTIIPESECCGESAACIDNPSAPRCACCPLDATKMEEQPKPTFLMQQHATLMSAAALAAVLLNVVTDYLPGM